MIVDDEKRQLRIAACNIKRLRLLNNFSQSVLARKLNISVTFLSNIETAKKFPSITTLLKISAVFDIDLYELFLPAEIPAYNTAILDRFTEDAVTSLRGLRNSYLKSLDD